MKNQSLSPTTSSDRSVWVILAGLLVFSAAIGAGTMALINFNNANIANQQAQAPAAAPAQTAPTPAAAH